MYCSIACLPPHIASQLSSILLTMLMHTEDKKLCSNKKVFQKLIEELNFLSSSGINISVNGIQRNIKFQLTLILGDNLGLNSILGFVESFKASHFCRICKISNAKSMYQIFEDETLLRNYLNYEVYSSDCKKWQDTGIKEPCAFNQVDNYHVTRNICVDLMHDLCEGICMYIMREILYTYVFLKKYFTVQDLNDRIKNFQFGPTESSNKPPPISVNRIKNKENPKMSASEMLCFTRYFGLIVGDLIPEEDADWQLYKVLRCIIDIVTSPQLVLPDIKRLKKLITDLNKLFIDLYGYLKPKFHFFTHYPRILAMNGPCKNFWSMRFESRHTEVKANAEASKSQKNPLVTITTKQLLRMCQLFNCIKLDNNTKLGPVDDTFFQSRNHFCNSGSNVKKHKFVEINGTLYKIGSYLVTDMQESEIEFGQILEIIHVNENIFFYFQTYKEITFSDHVHAYIVKRNKSVKKCLNYNDVPNTMPALSVKKNDTHFIALRCGL